jgi:hypothetical protein
VEKGFIRMRTFDPAKVAYYETENWVAYYQKRWLRLLRVSVAMVQQTFGLRAWQAVYGAYLVARAEMAAAPFPDNDIPRAEQYMRRFYAYIKRLHYEHFDVDEVARLEVNWWVVHRQLFGQSENQPLVEALTDLYAASFSVPRERVREAAYRRAEAMLYSDRWVNEGRVSGSPLLVQVQAELEKSYAALLAAVAPVRAELPASAAAR